MTLKTGKRSIIKILLLGSGGQLGKAICSNFKHLYSIKALDRKKCDITNINDVRVCIKEFSPDVVINTAAFTKVDSAEKEMSDAMKVNCSGVNNICTVLKDTRVLFIHYSTDYVFDGKNSGFYNESSQENPINNYGKSKYMGEQEIKDIYDRHYILRVSWVYDNDSDNFPNKILKRYKDGLESKIVSDQTGSPTHVDLISHLTHHILKKYNKLSEEDRQRSFGLYHLSARGVTSWYDFAKYITKKYSDFKNLQFYSSRIKKCSSDELNSISNRPSNSALDCAKLEKFLSLKISTWQDYADKFIENKI
tara:strand:- start:22729 stop:23649 length:921 start_codon:yes stop_codon:yes gene_type:complete